MAGMKKVLVAKIVFIKCRDLTRKSDDPASPLPRICIITANGNGGCCGAFLRSRHENGKQHLLLLPMISCPRGTMLLHITRGISRRGGDCYTRTHTHTQVHIEYGCVCDVMSEWSKSIHYIKGPSYTMCNTSIRCQLLQKDRFCLKKNPGRRKSVSSWSEKVGVPYVAAQSRERLPPPFFETWHAHSLRKTCHVISQPYYTHTH